VCFPKYEKRCRFFTGLYAIKEVLKHIKDESEAAGISCVTTL
jgi:hypothetical protein